MFSTCSEQLEHSECNLQLLLNSNSWTLQLYLKMAKPSPLSRFVLPPPGAISGNYKAKCKHCGHSISGSSKTTSNFTTHLKVAKY